MAKGDATGTDPQAGTGDAAVRWRVDRRYLAAKLVVLAAAIASTAVLARDADRPGWFLAGAVSLAAAGYVARDLLAPVRLAADRHGVTVLHGVATRVDLSWGQIEQIRLDDRSRLGIPSVALEIDAGEQLFLLGRGDLGTEPAKVAQVLSALRESPSSPDN